MDVLSDVLHVLRLHASVFFHASFCGNWSVDSSGQNKATFHLIARGSCWLHSPVLRQPLSLRGGDLLVFPRDAVHVISASPQALSLPPHSGVITPATSRDVNEPATSLVCGYFEFDSTLSNPILSALPDVIHIRGEAAGNERLGQLLHLIISETESGEPGSDVIVDRMSDALFIQIIRSCMQNQSANTGLLAALADSKISRALTAFHDAPAKAWTVESLASVAGMSRAAFAKRFQQLLTLSPMLYVTRWRMQRAHELLRDGELSIAAIAEQNGYQSEAAFRKAFSQHTGIGPGAVRRRKIHSDQTV